jgi:SAM-dependent methyltransferase
MTPTTDDPFGGREPTSHERMTGVPWDASYYDGPAPWDIGRPQPAFVRTGATGVFVSPVLDAGCGTGENALHVASLGLTVTGVDLAETAVDQARAKASGMGLAVEFRVADAFNLAALGQKYQTILDCGLLHTFDDAERPQYVASLASVTETGARLFVLCFSDRGPTIGPHPLSRDQVTGAFHDGSGWTLVGLEPDTVITRFHSHGAAAWFVTAERT